MSVLYKALARASKAREATGASGGEVARAGRGARRRRSFLRPLIILVVIVAAAGGAYVAVGNQIAETVKIILYGEPMAAQPAGASPARPQAAAPAAAAAPGSAPSSPAGAPQPGAPAPPAAEAAAAPASQTFEPVAVPEPAASPQLGPRPAEKVGEITPEQDLPAVLDRIRQQRGKPLPSSSVVVDRTTPAQGPTSPGRATASAPAPNAAAGMVSVTGESSSERDDAERAYDLLLHGQYEGALALYDEVLRLNDKSLPGLLGKAIALHKLRKYAEARELYQRVLAIDPGNREALTNVTSIIATQAPAAALSELRELQKLHPDFSPIPAEIATIDANTGNLVDAINAFNRAIQLSPENGLYRLNLAILQDRAGMVGDAVVSYQAALDRLDGSAQLPVPLDSVRARLRYLRSR